MHQIIVLVEFYIKKLMVNEKTFIFIHKNCQRTLSDKVVPIEKKNEIQSFVENFFLHRLVYNLSSNDFAFMDILGIYLYLGAETVLFQYSLDV